MRGILLEKPFATHIVPRNDKLFRGAIDSILLWKYISYSQRALSEKVGVNLRTLQQYEIRAKDINKAAGGTLLALAKVLGCRVEDLLEYDTGEIGES